MIRKPEAVMYERFTDRARKVMQLANQEALRLGRESLDTEHVLLGLLNEGSGVAANVLKQLRVDLRTLRLQVEVLAPSSDRIVTGKLPLGPQAKKLIEYTLEEARNLNHNYVGTEHLLLGLLREPESLAARALIRLGLSLEEVHDAVIQILGQQKDDALRPRPRYGRYGGRLETEYDLFVPLHYPDGTAVEPDKVDRVERRLIDRFGGVLRFPQERQGTWEVAGVTFQGEVLVLRVVVDLRTVIGGFFQGLVEHLKTDLRQKEILIVVRDIEIL
jgi:hypothetical protein